MKHRCTSGSPLWLDPDLRNKLGLCWRLGFPQATLGKLGVPFRAADTDPCGFSPNGSASSLLLAKVRYPPSACLFFGLDRSLGCSHIRTSHMRLGSCYLERAWCLHPSKWVMCSPTENPRSPAFGWVLCRRPGSVTEHYKVSKCVPDAAVCPLLPAERTVRGSQHSHSSCRFIRAMKGCTCLP